MRNIRHNPIKWVYISIFVKIQLMKKDIDPELKEVLLKVGEQVRKLRNEKSDKGYLKFAEDIQKQGIQVSKNTMYRMETGSGDYNLLSLISLLKHFNINASDFFKTCGL